jgi:hypothetical protein
MKTISKIFFFWPLLLLCSCLAPLPSMTGKNNMDTNSISLAKPNSASNNQGSEASVSKKENAEIAEKSSNERGSEGLDFRY